MEKTNGMPDSKNGATQIAEVPQTVTISTNIANFEKNAQFAEYLENELKIPGDVVKLITSHYQGNQKTLEEKMKLVEEIKDCFAENKTTLSTSEIFNFLGLQVDGVWPKNILGWYVLRSAIGKDCFNFSIPADSCHEIRKNKIIFNNYPTNIENGNYVPLGLAAIEAVKVYGFDINVAQKMKPVLDIGQIGIDFVTMMTGAHFVMPPKNVVNKLAKTIFQAKNTGQLVLVGAFCPDYSYEETGDAIIPYRYNFKSLNTGVGLVAQQFARTLPSILAFCQKHNINPVVKLGIGDFEADSDDVLRRMKLTKEQFVQKCAASLDAFRKTLPDIDMELCLLKAEWLGNNFGKFKTEAIEKMNDNDFGYIHDFSWRDIGHMAKASTRFYSDWFGKDINQDEISNIIMQQGAEYSAVSRCFVEDFPNQAILQIAGDRPAMQLFNNLFVQIATICTKRIYG